MRNFLKENWFKVGILLVALIILIMNFAYQIFSNIVFQTVLAGTLVYIFGQIIQLFILEKIYKYREIIGKINNRLKFYHKIIKTPGIYNQKEGSLREKMVRDCSQELLQLSCDLESCRGQLIFRNKQMDKNVSQASKLLFDLHIGVFGKSESMSNQNLKNLEEIRKLLNIPKLSD